MEERDLGFYHMFWERGILVSMEGGEMRDRRASEAFTLGNTSECQEHTVGLKKDSY